MNETSWLYYKRKIKDFHDQWAASVGNVDIIYGSATGLLPFPK